MWYAERARPPFEASMQARSATLILGAICWIAIGTAGLFLFSSEKLLTTRRAQIRAFDQRARDAARALSDLRSAQQAYVAAGQGGEFWVPKVAGLATEASDAVEALRALDVGAEPLLLASGATAAIADFRAADVRAREYLQAGQTLMASDVVFAEGGEAATLAARQIDAARAAAERELAAAEAATRRRQAYVLSAAAAIASLVVAWIVAGASRRERRDRSRTVLDLSSVPVTAPPVAAKDDAAPRHAVPGLKAAAALCTELGRVNDPKDLEALLGRIADMMDASGLVVWIGNTAGADLQAVLAHGYSPQALARMPAVPRTADNAAAAAYRSGALQIVLARPGVSSGALVAPMLSPEGCVGALTAEIRGGGETSDTVQALAALVAAQLTSVLAPSALTLPQTSEGRIASA
jgi:hypothetical protein